MVTNVGLDDEIKERTLRAKMRASVGDYSTNPREGPWMRRSCGVGQNCCSQDGEVTIDEFKKAVQDACVGKKYDVFPPCFKTVIAKFFKTIDINGR